MKRSTLIVLIALATGLALVTGCQDAKRTDMMTSLQAGELGRARLAVEAGGEPKKEDRNYLLQKVRIGILTLADGYAYSEDPRVVSIFEILRTQGLNKDKTVNAVFLNDGVTIWKGEPFEQALTLAYIAEHFAVLGDWGNVRAAAMSSLFPLKSFASKPGENLSPEQLAAKANQAKTDEEKNLKSGYKVAETDFVLGYLLTGIANQQLARGSGDSSRLDEAMDYYAGAVKVDPSIKPVVEQLRGGEYNTILIVDFGLGPEKYGRGPDNAIADFRPRTQSDSREAQVQINGSAAVAFPVACDVNKMAMDHKWKNLEDVRLVKSVVGTGMTVAGTAMMAQNQSSEMAMAGAGLALIGLLAKANAHAAVDYAEVVPQRTYVIPLQIEEQNTTVSLTVGNARMVLAGLAPPDEDQGAQVRNVRLFAPPPAWAVSGKILYCNDYAPLACNVMLPYILGGECVCPPSAEALSRYQQAGFLSGMTLGELESLYRDEKITWTIQDEKGSPKLHVLEGGTSLLCPLPGTTGFARLFGQRHGPYAAKSPRVQELARRCAAEIRQHQSAPAGGVVSAGR